MEPALLLILFFVIAFLYSAIGHGGASGYLALMAIAGTAPAMMKPSALTLNLLVSAIAAVQFYRAGLFNKKLFLPFAAASIPCSFLGALMILPDPVYKMILGACLCIATLRIVGVFGLFRIPNSSSTPPLWAALCIGGAIGLISGMIGIGGGILLSPVLILFGWAGIRESAAVAAPFIYVNSLSGIAGLLTHHVAIAPQTQFWLLAALLGGLSGAYAGSTRFNTPTLKYVLSIVLLIAAGKLLLGS